MLENAKIHPSAKFNPAKVSIGIGVRIDAKCVITDGVTIGRGAWLRANSVIERSVPPYAVVDGNPAEVRHFLNFGSNGVEEYAPLIKLENSEFRTASTAIELPVIGCKIHRLKQFTDSRGSLTVGEVPIDVPFLPKRYFTISDVPESDLRGEHAHKGCQQFLICITGSCHVLIDDGIRRCTVLLDKPNFGLLMPGGIWGTQYKYSKGCVLLVFASRLYESDDYIKSYEEFLRYCNAI